MAPNWDKDGDPPSFTHVITWLSDGLPPERLFGENFARFKLGRKHGNQKACAKEIADYIVAQDTSEHRSELACQKKVNDMYESWKSASQWRYGTAHDEGQHRINEAPTSMKGQVEDLVHRKTLACCPFWEVVDPIFNKKWAEGQRDVWTHSEETADSTAGIPQSQSAAATTAPGIGSSTSGTVPTAPEATSSTIQADDAQSRGEKRKDDGEMDTYKKRKLAVMERQLEMQEVQLELEREKIKLKERDLDRKTKLAYWEIAIALEKDNPALTREEALQEAKELYARM